ncbi:MAG: hypothetical protein WC764_03835 [Candidatus Paceibacterota bacterium]|jgi:hypothetical protein
MPEFVSLNLEYLFYQIYKFFYSFTHNTPSLPVVPAHTFSYSSVFILASILISALLIWAIAYLLIKTRQYHIEYEWALYNQSQENKAATTKEENPKWKSVLSFAESDNPSDRKVAIIEADKLLDDALQAGNIPGENLGERLKNFDAKTTPWLDDAWEAHKIRNRIAHEAEFDPNVHDIKKTIARYERVLHELRAI